MRVLLVEDDRMIGEAVKQALKDAAYAVDWVRDAPSAITAYKTQVYNLILLDLGLPLGDGFDVLQQIRRHKTKEAIPLLIVTARDAVEDRIRGLDEGADDYMLKPFEMGELLARIRAVIRRQTGSVHPVMSNGYISLDPKTHEASFEQKTIRLTGREFALLQALMARPGAILSRKELEDHLYGWNEEIASNAVEFLIHSLRKKFDSRIIKNVRGVGWMVSKES